MTSGVYSITNKINGHQYIGSSANIEIRWTKHRSKLNGGKHHSPHLQHAWDIYKKGVFVFDILSKCDPRELLLTEQHFIDNLHPVYNVCITAGNRLGSPHSKETKKKLSLANIGKKASSETRAKMSLASKGKAKPNFSEEHRKNIGLSRLGIRHTDEAKKKISLALKGKPLSEGNKHGISISMLGNTNTLGKHWKWRKKNSE
jgi:group I intron endonuclease